MDSCLKNTYAQVRMTFSNILYVFEYAHVIASSFSQSENIKYSNVVILGCIHYFKMKKCSPELKMSLIYITKIQTANIVCNTISITLPAVVLPQVFDHCYKVSLLVRNILGLFNTRSRQNQWPS